MLHLMLFFSLGFSLAGAAVGFNFDQWQHLIRIRLIVPSADISTTVTRFYLGQATWEIDLWETQVGHFEGTSWIETAGNIVLGGHVEYPDNTPGVFANLEAVQPGEVVILRAGGIEKRYRVFETKLVDQHDLTVLYPTQEDQITLITCDEASFDDVTKTYNKRLVVIAKLIN